MIEVIIYFLLGAFIGLIPIGFLRLELKISKFEQKIKDLEKSQRQTNDIIVHDWNRKLKKGKEDDNMRYL